MANLTPTPGWDNVFQLETDTPVLGGAGGVANSQAQALLNRFGFLEGETGSSKVGHTPAGTGAVETTVEAQLQFLQQQTINVKDAPFYAVGDGVADDTSAILAALVSIQATGGALYFPRGTYMTDAIDLRGYLNITLYGDGEYSEFQYVPTSVIKIRTAATTGIKLADDNLEVPVSLATGIVIRDLAIDANNLATTAINMCRAVKMINCKVTNAVQDGIIFEGGSYPIALTHVVSQGNGRDGLRVRPALTTVYTIRDCEFGFNGGNGVTIFDGSTCILENVLCQSNAGNGFEVELLDPSGFTNPIFLERIVFKTCYSEANAGFGFLTNSYDTNPALFAGKIPQLTFINCSFNSSVGQTVSFRGLASPKVINCSFSPSAIDPAFNTVEQDRAAEYEETDWTARISQQQTNYFTTTGTTSARYQVVGNWVNCSVVYSWSDKGIANAAFNAILDLLPEFAKGGGFVHGASSCSIQVPGGSTDVWHLIPIGATKTCQFIKNNDTAFATIGDLPTAGTLTAQFSYISSPS